MMKKTRKDTQERDARPDPLPGNNRPERMPHEKSIVFLCQEIKFNPNPRKDIMKEMALFFEENCEAEILEETREIR